MSSGRSCPRPTWARCCAARSKTPRDSSSAGSRIGLISDTHGLLRPEALAALAGSDRIIHAGDIGDPAILAALRRIAPVAAVRGNNDRDDWAHAIPERRVLRVQGMRILVLHDVKDLHREPPPSGTQVVVSGHSHVPRIHEEGGVLYLNPGSAGPRRFKLPVSVGFLELRKGRSHATTVRLDV